MMENNLVLPIEVWTEVFGHLSHTQKLISRLVCKEWNRQISKDLAKTYFSIKSIESHEVLLESDVPWTKLRIGEYSSSGLALPPKFRNVITSIQLKISGLKECMAIVIRFPVLTDLDVTITEDRNKKRDSNDSAEPVSQELKDSFEKCLEKLKYLSITFPYLRYSALYELLDGFRQEKICFLGLEVQEEDYSFKHISGTVDDHSCRELALKQIYSIVCKSAQTLISLGLKINDPNDRFRGLFFSELISKLTTVADLNLQTVRIHAEPSSQNKDRDFAALRSFLKSQTKMKNVILPWFYKGSHNVSQEFVLSLPRDLESIECLTREHVTDEFWLKFTKLERISIVSCKPSMFNSIEQYPTIRVFQMNFREDFAMTTKDTDMFHRSISNLFVNLAELHIVTCGDRWYHGTELQLVIRYFKQLRVLEIRDCTGLYDYGVTGIEGAYVEELTETGRIYRCLEVPKDHVEGLPMSSLKSLEKLVLLKSHITDSGIYYGLQFGPQLKHLVFGVSVNADMERVKVTEWGLHWLAAGNPALEVFDVRLANQTISKNGIEDLRRQLPLVESTGKFRVVNNREFE